MVNNDEFEGAARDIGGKIQDAAGGLSGDTITQARGKWNQAAGKAQKTFGEATEELRDGVTGSPLSALAIIGAIGFALGFFSRR